ncbi:pentapeptide repeat protein [Calothrix parasitica NIES-267]|uniref:Pentapeptide repeat protein n=1 Tax=Calothrix parasitica NIES-267 TaxID=1973488 RepID=A0A1Z4LQL7_9CYAN|nr:pentapeptide repeat protein [Calothrix parasitica NIES-267]
MGSFCLLPPSFCLLNAEELLERYAAGERDFSGINLSGIDLSETDLLRINLSCANLSGANLFTARLYGAFNPKMLGYGAFSITHETQMYLRL